MKRLALALAVWLLAACASEPVRVVCVAEGEVVFDQPFERAEIQGAQMVAWHDGQSAVIEGDCAIAPAR